MARKNDSKSKKIPVAKRTAEKEAVSEKPFALPEVESITSTAEVPVPKLIIEQVIGQAKATDVIRKASQQKRNVLLVGYPGTGKSLLAQAMAELLPASELEDIVVLANPLDENTPKIKSVKAGDGRKMLSAERMKAQIPGGNTNIFLIVFLFLSSFFLLYYGRQNFGDVITAAMLIGLFIVSAMLAFASQLGRRGLLAPGIYEGMKLIVDNHDKKKAPFVDASGSRASALLGDVKHDPLQTIFYYSAVTKVENGNSRQVLLGDLVDELVEKNKAELIRQDGYEAVFVPPAQNVFVLGEKDGKICPVRVLSVNRRHYEGAMVNVRTGGHKLTVTPEHGIFDGRKYAPAEEFFDEAGVAAPPQVLLSEADIISTFSKNEQERAQSYKNFLELRKSNPGIGYRKAARLLGVSAGRTRWWYKNSKPHAIRTVEWLKDRNLLPLYSDDARLPAIAKIVGCTFGDGGIAINLNNLYLSSSEESSLIEFQNDLVEVFGSELESGFSVIISGVNKSGRCIRNTNRAAVRFFVALKAEVGRKNKELEIPSWIYARESAALAFFGAFLGNEFCSPKFIGGGMTAFGVAMCGNERLRENRLQFLRQFETFLNSYGIHCTSICETKYRDSMMWRLLIRQDIENVSRFIRFIPLHYSNSKKERLLKAFEEQFSDKRKKLLNLENAGYGQQYLTRVLRATSDILRKIKVETDFEQDDKKIWFSGVICNVTTESGNLFASGLLVKNSGGLGTPAHLRVEPGAVHKAHKGVLFIDEIATLSFKTQQELLTAMQEKKYSISGQSEMSSGALVHSEPVPCDFVLIASGNYHDVQKMHPALRSRIRGYGYEVYMEESIADTPENRAKIMQFVAQEVVKDGKIPHFSREAVQEIIRESRKRAGRKNKLTLKLRELGGLVRAAGDLALERKNALVTLQDVLDAKKLARTLEQQVAQQMIDLRRDYRVFLAQGYSVGKVNGLAVMGESGVILPIVAEVAPAASKQEGRIIATGKLGEIAKEAVENVSAIIKRHTGKDTSSFDIHVQFLQTYEGVEGDSASISVATAVISALEEVPIDQTVAFTGSLSVRGEVLPVGGVTHKIDAALEAGMKKVLVPRANFEDLSREEWTGKIELIPVSNLHEVLQHALKPGGKKQKLLAKIKKEFTS